jgi:hypothetical protein
LPQKDVIEVERTVTAPFAPMPKTIADGSRRRATVWGRSRVPGSPAASIAEPYDPGSNVNLSATAALGSIFVGWARCGTVELDGTCTMNMSGTKTLTAEFDALILGPSNPSMSFPVLLRKRLIG